jgi:uncharacterized repeat protein (TIGR04138 family)
MSATEVPFWQAVDDIRAGDGRYLREAYGFVVAALGHTVQSLPAERLSDPERRHLSGGELLQGVVRLARSEFGAMAATVFREWGVVSNEDVGAIVFQLVRCGQLSARPEDSLEDFGEGPELLEALGEPPSPPRAPRPSRGSSAEPQSGAPPEGER